MLVRGDEDVFKFAYDVYVEWVDLNFKIRNCFGENCSVCPSRLKVYLIRHIPIILKICSQYHIDLEYAYIFCRYNICRDLFDVLLLHHLRSLKDKIVDPTIFETDLFLWDIFYDDIKLLWNINTQQFCLSDSMDINSLYANNLLYPRKF